MRGMEILCVMLMAAITASSASSSTVTDFSQLDKAIQEELKTTNTPGCAVAIVSGDKIVYAKGFGVANLETDQPVKPETLFMIGSTTKMFTAYTLLSVAENGKLDINKPIGNYIKGLSPKLSGVTASELLSMTAGLKDISSVPQDGKWDYQSGLEKYVRSLNDSMLFTEPGEIFSYSNPGFSTAGYLTEIVSGKPYADAVKERVLGPLGMNNSTFHLEEAVTYPMSVGHDDFTGKIRVQRPYDEVTPMWPGGFLISNIYDMAKFAAALMNNGTLSGEQILSPSIIKEMSSPHARIFSAVTNGSYGYGTELINYYGIDTVGHAGNAMGFTSVFMTMPERKLALIILNNGAVRDMPNLTRKAFELMMVPLKPDVVKTLEMNESEMEQYVGNYSQDTGSVYSIKARDGKLLFSQGGVLLPGQQPFEYSVVKLARGQFGIMFPGYPDPWPIGLIKGKDGKVKYLHRGERAYVRMAS